MMNKKYPENTFELPHDFEEYLVMDLLQNRKELKTISILSLVIVIVMVVLGILILNMTDAHGEFSWGGFLLKAVVLVFGILLYMVLHELVHGVFIKKYSGKKAYYGYGFGYAYASSDAYFNKKSYIVIALSPVILWGIVLLVLNFVLPFSWFWVIYGIQIMNLSGAAGDFYVSYKISNLTDNILIFDSETKTIVYREKL